MMYRPSLALPILGVLFALALFFFYLAGVVSSPLYPNIQPQYIREMPVAEKDALRSCQLDKIWRERGFTRMAEYADGVAKRSDRFWERRYLMYEDSYWCNAFERRRYIEPSGSSASPFDTLKSWLTQVE